jgi:hypothetical protein
MPPVSAIDATVSGGAVTAGDLTTPRFGASSSVITPTPSPSRRAALFILAHRFNPQQPPERFTALQYGHGTARQAAAIRL